MDYYEAGMKEKLLESGQEKSKMFQQIRQEMNTCKERINKARKMMLDEIMEPEDFREIKAEFQPMINKLTRKEAEIASMTLIVNNMRNLASTSSEILQTTIKQRIYMQSRS
jgi:hypothetical protein